MAAPAEPRHAATGPFDREMEKSGRKLIRYVDEALTMNLELMSHITGQNGKDIAALKARVAQDAENIRALARIAEPHS